MMFSSVRGMRKGVSGPRNTRAARPVQAVNTNDLVVEFGFDDSGSFAKLFEGYAWEAMARGGTPGDVAEEAAAEAWGDMATGGSAEPAANVDQAAAKAEAQAWISSWRSKSREEAAASRAAADKKAADKKAAAEKKAEAEQKAAIEKKAAEDKKAAAEKQAAEKQAAAEKKAAAAAVASNGAASENAGASEDGAAEARAWIAAWRSKNSGSQDIVDVGVWPPPEASATTNEEAATV